MATITRQRTGKRTTHTTVADGAFSCGWGKDMGTNKEYFSVSVHEWDPNDPDSVSNLYTLRMTLENARRLAALIAEHAPQIQKECVGCDQEQTCEGALEPLASGLEHDCYRSA